jgi:hypothetical protein
MENSLGSTDQANMPVNNPNVPVQPPVSQPLPKQPDSKSSQQNLLKIVIILLVILVVIMGAGMIYLVQKLQKQTISQTVISNAIPTLIPSSTSTIQVDEMASTETYTYNAFSFSYPTDWNVFDTTTNAEFFNNYSSLNGFDHGVVVEKGDELLFIGVNKYASGGEAGGIFLTDTEFNEWKNGRDEVMIDDGIFYLGKDHTLLENLGKSHGGIFGIASLAEYISSKQIQNGNSYKGWEDYIQNKEGYSYIFVKLSKNDTEDSKTPANVQQEIKDILQTVKFTK